MTFTEEQAVEVDRCMSDHMYQHTISNSYAGMACDVECRTQAILRAVRAALETEEDE